MVCDRYNIYVEILKKYANAYYIEDNPLVTDEEYDKLYNIVKSIEEEGNVTVDPTSPTQRVGAPLKDGFKKAKHIEKMWSMDNVFNIEEFREWYDKVKGDTDFYIEPKFDGASLNLIYENGKLTKAITRGDGETGEDVTNNAKAIKSIKLEIDYKGTIEIRGEVLIGYRDFERINKEQLRDKKELYVTPRNLASGTLRQIDPRVVSDRNLFFIPWGVGHNNLSLTTQSGLMDFIYSLGFKKPFYKNITDNILKISDDYEYFLRIRNNLDYMIDGMVVKVNRLEKQKTLGYTNKSPKFMIAFKFPAIEKETKLLNVINQVGRTGVITPVAILEPINIDNVTVERVTLNNYDYIKDMDLKLNDSVILIRSGDVIPKIIKVLKNKRTNPIDIEEPKKCPVCSSKLIKIDKTLKCVNKECPSRVINKLIYFTSRECMNIDGLGDKTIEELYNKGLVKDFIDIYNLNNDKLSKLNNFKERKINRILDSIYKSKNIDCWRFLKALGIPEVGEKVSKDICRRYKSKFTELTEDELLSINGIGEEVVVSYLNYMHDNKDKIKELLELIIIKFTNDKIKSIFTNKKIAITGKLDISRDILKEELEEMGGIIVNTVNRNTDYLIVGDNPGSKYKKAKSIGVKTINEEELRKIITRRYNEN